MAQPTQAAPGIAPGRLLANHIAENPTTARRALGVACAPPAALAGGTAAFVSSVVAVPLVVIGGGVGVLGDVVRKKSTQDPNSYTQKFGRKMSLYFKYTVRTPLRTAKDCARIAKASCLGSNEKLCEVAAKVSVPIADRAYSLTRSVSLLELEDLPISDSASLRACRKIEKFRADNPGNYGAKVAASLGHVILTPLAGAETAVRTVVQYPVSKLRNLARKAGKFFFRKIEREFTFVQVKLYRGVNRSAQAFCMSTAGSATTLVSHQLYTQVGDVIFRGLEGKTDVLLNVLNRVSPGAILRATGGDFSLLVREIFMGIFEEIHREEEEMPEEAVLEIMIRERLEVVVPQIPLIIHEVLNRMPFAGAIIIARFLQREISYWNILLLGMHRLFQAEARVLIALRDTLLAEIDRFDLPNLAEAWRQHINQQLLWQSTNEDGEVLARLIHIAGEQYQEIPRAQVFENLPTYRECWLNAIAAIADFHKLDLDEEVNRDHVRNCLQASYQGMQFYTGLARDPNIGVALSYLVKCLELQHENRNRIVAYVNGSADLLGNYFRGWDHRGPAPPERALYRREFLLVWDKLFLTNPAKAYEILDQIPQAEDVFPELFQA